MFHNCERAFVFRNRLSHARFFPDSFRLNIKSIGTHRTRMLLGRIIVICTESHEAMYVITRGSVRNHTRQCTESREAVYAITRGSSDCYIYVTQ